MFGLGTVELLVLGFFGLGAIVVVIVMVLATSGGGTPPPPGGLIGCPACGQGVSPFAPTCPHCGHPIAGPPK